MTRPLRLRIADGPKHVEFQADINTVTRQIVNDEREALGPDTLFQRGNRWYPLKEHIEAPWLDELADHAVRTLQAGDIEACEVVSNRILRYGNRRECEALCVADLLLGHIGFVSGQLDAAISHWQSAARSRSRVQAAAYSNLGTTWALARQPVAAIECLDMAIASNPKLLVPHLSRQNLADTLVKEQAPDLPGQATWDAIYRISSEHIRESNRANIIELLAPNCPFPTYHVMHIFQPGPYCPAISCQMPCIDVKEPAARYLLDAGNTAFHEAKYDLALRLARRAAVMSAQVAPSANTLLAVSEAKISELEHQEEASRYVKAASAFFESLRHMGSDLTEPAEFLAILEAHETDHHEYRQLYRDAVMASIYDHLRTCPERQKRTWLLTLCGLHADGPLAGAYSKAANTRRARPFLQKFWNACAHQDMTAAALALEKAEIHLGGELNDMHRVLDTLKSICSRPTPRRKSKRTQPSSGTVNT